MKNFLGEVQRDLRFALRSLNKDRRFTLLAVLALALGIGSVTVIFSAIYGVVIDTFPYPHFGRMVSFSIDPHRTSRWEQAGNALHPHESRRSRE